MEKLATGFFPDYIFFIRALLYVDGAILHVKLENWLKTNFAVYQRRFDRIVDRARLFTNCGYGLEEFWKEDVSWNFKFSRFSLRIFDDILLRGYVKCWESRRARYRDKRFANEPVRDEKCWNIIQCSTHGQLHSRFRWHAQTPAVCAAQWNPRFLTLWWPLLSINWKTWRVSCIILFTPEQYWKWQLLNFS